MENTVNCAEVCINGCVLGDKCPNKEYLKEASKFIDDTPLDKMLEIAEEAVMKKRMAPPKWVIPEFPE
ncbi:MAG: hypothetical protein F6K39_04395 [Okeania sp. SIO3B3]|nr:hypothetical protein [Okeania sp. SIO3B3]